MSELNLIKTVLFNAQNLNEALTKLTELGIAYRACTFTDNGYHITGYDITFWPTSSLRCPLAVCINGNLFDYDDRRSFLAPQPEPVETPVPAASPDAVEGYPVLAAKIPQDEPAAERPALTEAEIKLVQQYRADNGFNHGYVIVYNGEVGGWKAVLDNPQGWCPHCIAVDADLNCWLAIGGNDYDGAKKWVPILAAKISETAPYRCQFCGAPSYLAPSEQALPADYCHASDHGEPELSTESVDNNPASVNFWAYAEPEALRTVLREERRLKRSLARGLSS